MDSKTRLALMEHMQQFLTDQRKALFEKVLSFRTRHITVVMEDIFQSQNASAVLRTCDLNGIQDIHIIENNYAYDVNPDVALGSSKWLNLIKHNEQEQNTLETFKQLRSEGYQIVATSPHKDDFTPETLPLDQKLALVFGTELTGLSETAIENADTYVRIPMYGFTESYNISVSAALLLYTLTHRLKATEIDWQLSEAEIRDIKLKWAMRTIDRSDVIERHFLKSYNP